MKTAPQACSCDCHGGFEKACSIEGGCGHLHDSNVRPEWACVICRPPMEGRMWHRASDGYRTCEPCLERLGALLAEISDRYSKLSPAPRGRQFGDDARGNPGFGSRSPASDHIIVMMDPRSASGENARTWRGADGRLHQESEHPPLSIFSVLDTIAWDIAEARGFEGHKQLSVQGLCEWLDAQLDWLTRRADVVALHGTLRSLVNQLRPVTGEPRKRIGFCPNTIDEGESARECKAPLYAPTHGSYSIATNTIRCRACGRSWSRAEWLRLADLLDAS